MVPTTKIDSLMKCTYPESIFLREVLCMYLWYYQWMDPGTWEIENTIFWLHKRISFKQVQSLKSDSQRSKILCFFLMMFDISLKKNNNTRHAISMQFFITFFSYQYLVNRQFTRHAISMQFFYHFLSVISIWLIGKLRSGDLRFYGTASLRSKDNKRNYICFTAVTYLHSIDLL